MKDLRVLRRVTPSQRGWRFVAEFLGQPVCSNTPYVVVTAAVVTHHYSARGAIERVRLLAIYNVQAMALAFEESPPRWESMDTSRRPS